MLQPTFRLASSNKQSITLLNGERKLHKTLFFDLNHHIPDAIAPTLVLIMNDFKLSKKLACLFAGSCRSYQ